MFVASAIADANSLSYTKDKLSTQSGLVYNVKVLYIYLLFII